MRKLIHAEIVEQRISGEDALAATRHPVAAVLEDIRSLYNVGSCFRTADAMLLRKLMLTGYTPAPPRKEISKTALGATESVPWEHIRDPLEGVLKLRDEGYRIYALEITDGSMRLDSIEPLPFPVAFVAGNEIAGVGAGTLAHCDGAIEIPMYGVKHSLNVAVAFGIAAWELVRMARRIAPSYL
ncbi:MAG: methyltransferase [Chlorobi bacterium]|nr:methyltransferase [Chlorobiota bacterium]